ncbi:MAG: carboxypeptidase regulatory-like domain-containing protein, partial [Thermoplasmata archaeon]
NADDEINWTYSGNTDLTVTIDANRVASIEASAGWTGAETITFRATDPGTLYAEDSATFTVTSTLVAYYPLNGNANDESGYGNHGTELNGVQYDVGVLDLAASFDGIDDKILVADNNQLHLGNDSFSISCWIKTTSAEVHSIILDKDLNFDASGTYRIAINPYDTLIGSASFWLQDYGGSINSIESTTIINDGYWHHIVGVRDLDTGLLHIYVDGSEDAVPVDYTLLGSTDNTEPLAFGGGSTADVYPYEGMIDDVRIFNRPLTEIDAQTLYNDIASQIDQDGDGLFDADEINIHGTNPFNPDSDGDGLFDADEVNIYDTDPNNPDSDGDWVSDGDEVNNGTLPNDPLSFTPSGTGAIRGTVKDDGGSAITGIEIRVDVYSGNSCGGAYVTSVYTDSTNGNYIVTGLAPGSYYVRTENRNESNYANEWWADQASVFECFNAQAVAVSDGVLSDEINFQLDVGGQISGEVSQDPSLGGGPVGGIRVMAYNYYHGSNGGHGETFTESDGSYLIIGLPPGDYRVEVDISGTDYAHEFYDDVHNSDFATAVSVSSGIETPNINFVMELGGKISGVVTSDSDGQPQEGLWVSARDYPTNEGVGHTQTQSDGSYLLIGLITGIYKVEVETSGTEFAYEFYDNKFSQDEATPVEVSAGDITTGINFSLGLGGSISGFVTRDSDGQPVENIRLHVHDFYNGTWFGQAYTDSNGAYTLSGLPEGDYRVEVDTWNTPYVREYYSDTYIWDDATPVSVTPGSDTSGINFGLALGGTISGIVTRDSDGQPIEGVSIEVWEYETWEGFGGYTTLSDGTYTITGLPSGTFRVMANAAGTAYAGEYYNNTYNSNLAEEINVTAGMTVTGINFGLGQGGSISGVVESDAGQPIPNAWVSAHNYDNGTWFGGVNTESDGSYTLSGLPSGDYRVEVDPWNTPYLWEYYNNTYNWDDATPVSVTPGSDTSGINFGLALGGVISGRVLDQQTGSPVEDKSVGSLDLSIGWHKFVYRQTEGEGGQSSRAAFKAPGDTSWRIFATSALDIRTAPDGAQTGILLVNKRNTCSYQWPNTHARLVKCVDTEATSEPGWYGESIVDRVYHDNNIHGNSDYYTSYYEAYFYVDSEGTWLFSTDSDDASEIEIDDNVVAAWYGG